MSQKIRIKLKSYDHNLVMKLELPSGVEVEIKV